MNAKTEARVKAHGRKLLAIFPNASNREEPVKLCKRLRRIETAAGHLAERYCNGTIEAEDYERRQETHHARMRGILGVPRGEHEIPVFINSDPRGYALKIKSEYVAEHNLDIERDWGGYGLIAPDLT